MTSLCVVHNNVDDASAIGKLARWAVRSALEADLDVTVVAKDLDPDLRGEVSWRPLYVPPPPHVVQWSAARATIRRAMRGVDPDVLHVFQAQVAALADLWHCQYLSRAAWDAGGFADGSGLHARIDRFQQQTVTFEEEWYLRRIPATTLVAYCSAEQQRSFEQRYPVPARTQVLLNPSPAVEDIPEDERRAARLALVGGAPDDAVVVGFLGGVDPRKGYHELLDAAVADERVVVLFAGPHADDFTDARLGSRLRVLGHLSAAELRPFYAACDVLAVPSRFEPFGMVVTEAAAHGVPSIVSAAVGAADLVSEFAAGVVWDLEVETFQHAITRIVQARSTYRQAALALAAATSERTVGAELIELYRSIDEWKRRNRRAASARG